MHIVVVYVELGGTSVNVCIMSYPTFLSYNEYSMDATGQRMSLTHIETLSPFLPVACKKSTLCASLNEYSHWLGYTRSVESGGLEACRMCVPGECGLRYSCNATHGPWPLPGSEKSREYCTGTSLYCIDDGTIKIRGDMECPLAKLNVV